MIVIYDDAGASAMCVDALVRLFKSFNLDFVTLTGAQIQTGEWVSQSHLFVMPGGRSLPFYQTLGEQGNQHIIDFVRKGGNYLGICAGAYYASNKTLFAKELPYELCLDGPLDFFEGSAIGPVFNAASFEYESEAGASVVDISLRDNTTVSIYHNGGCYFDKTGDSEVIARYDNDLPAIISLKVGLGHVVLSGVHFEIYPDDRLIQQLFGGTLVTLHVSFLIPP
jgi:glutamine amidotransferase-like uncharacterized protein